MGISIKHDEIEALIRELAQRRGSSLTEAIGEAVRNELARAVAPAPSSSFVESVRLIQDRVSRYEVRSLSADDIIGYDQDGMPT